MRIEVSSASFANAAVTATIVGATSFFWTRGFETKLPRGTFIFLGTILIVTAELLANGVAVHFGWAKDFLHPHSWAALLAMFIGFELAKRSRPRFSEETR